MYHFVGHGCLVTKNDHERLLANIYYKKTLLELVEMLGWLSSDRTFSTDFYRRKTIEISQLPNIIHMSTINTSLFCVITSKSMLIGNCLSVISSPASCRSDAQCKYGSRFQVFGNSEAWNQQFDK